MAANIEKRISAWMQEIERLGVHKNWCGAHCFQQCAVAPRRQCVSTTGEGPAYQHTRQGQKFGPRYPFDLNPAFTELWIIEAYWPKVGFYGLDSLHASMKVVLHYLEKVDPEAGKRARERYSCFGFMTGS